MTNAMEAAISQEAKLKVNSMTDAIEKELPSATQDETAEHWDRRIKRSRYRMAFCTRSIPAYPLPEGMFLAHNDGAFVDDGPFGFRAWVQRGSHNLTPCSCDWGGQYFDRSGKPTEVEHYRIKLMGRRPSDSDRT
jgi:hypothetical protein